MNALAKNQPTDIVTQAPQQGGGEQILASDVVIPRLWLMQGLSEMVSEGRAKPGEIRRSVGGDLVGDPTHPIEFIPLTFQNKWVIQESPKPGAKYEYRKTLSRDGGLDDSRKIITDQTGENLPWDFTHGGTQWKRVKVLNVFALLVSDIEAELAEFAKFKATGEIPDLNKTLLPVMISFRSTSYNAGKGVVSHFVKALSPAQAKFGVKPYQYTLKLSCYSDKNDKGTFFVYDVGQGRKCESEAKGGKPELERATDWAKTLGANIDSVKVDDSEEGEAAGGGTDESAKSQF